MGKFCELLREYKRTAVFSREEASLLETGEQVRVNSIHHEMCKIYKIKCFSVTKRFVIYLGEVGLIA